MKFYRIAILLPLLLFAQPALAANDSLLPGDVMNAIGYVAIILALILFLAVMLMLLRTFKVLTRIILKMDGYTEEQIAAEMAPAKKGEKAHRRSME